MSCLGNAATIKELRELAKKFAPTVLCVQETQIHKSWVVEGLKGTLGFDNSFAVSSNGRSGGIGFFLISTPTTIMPVRCYGQQNHETSLPWIHTRVT
jgi:exonuclease III